ncbi:DUF433 domain-containing protein, partial [Candidatus Poribacteria bacterium]|nr:DUF433 domain-containing protein [Candidatus Poribacteria bacterium]
DVLEMVAEETDWDRMVYGGRLGIPKEAIVEAMSIVSQVFAQKDGKPMARIELGKYVVANPNICHGVLTFKGTERCIQDVLKMVAEEIAWDEILHRWHDGITKEAIAEAILIASQIFIRLKEKPTQRLEYGKYVVADPRICHGIVTFNGTRIFVQTALKMVADEMAWEQIMWECHDRITKEAIAEAITLASQALIQRLIPFLVSNATICRSQTGGHGSMGVS